MRTICVSHTLEKKLLKFYGVFLDLRRYLHQWHEFAQIVIPCSCLNLRCIINQQICKIVIALANLAEVLSHHNVGSQKWSIANFSVPSSVLYHFRLLYLQTPGKTSAYIESIYGPPKMSLRPQVREILGSDEYPKSFATANFKPVPVWYVVKRHNGAVVKNQKGEVEYCPYPEHAIDFGGPTLADPTLNCFMKTRGNH